MKSIKVTLKDDTANGPQKYRIGSETTIGYKIPRDYVEKDLSDSFYDPLKAPGVYILVGRRVSDKKESVYIGQSDNVAKRLYEHKGGQDGEKQQGKMFWSECLAFVTSDDQMHKGHAEYLEGQFYKRAYEAGRYLLENNNTPSEKVISEEDQIFCDDFEGDCELLSALMGVPVFTPKEEDVTGTSGSRKLLINNGAKKGHDDPRYVNATGCEYQTVEGERGFLVLENSIIAKELTKNASPSIKKQRRMLKKRGYIKEEDGKLIFKKEYIFKSAGIAASFVLGRNAVAKEWKGSRE